MIELADKLRHEFQDKEYRQAYADEFLNASIATQIKVLREQHPWTQEELAEKAGMKQSRISILENVNYSAWSLTTLKRLAEAFDVTLKVSFESYSARLLDIQRFGRESLERFSFDEDPVFQNDLEPMKAGALKASLEQSTGPTQGDNVLDFTAYKRERERVQGALKHWQEKTSTVSAPASAISHGITQMPLSQAVG